MPLAHFPLIGTEATGGHDRTTDRTTLVIDLFLMVSDDDGVGGGSSGAKQSCLVRNSVGTGVHHPDVTEVAVPLTHV